MNAFILKNKIKRMSSLVTTVQQFPHFLKLGFIEHIDSHATFLLGVQISC